MKHTPGPWIVCGPTIQSAPTDSAPTGYAIAHVLNPYAGATGSAARVDANAALIAASPAMLAALQSALCDAKPTSRREYWRDGADGKSSELVREETWPDWIAAARDAIRAATGE